MERSVKFEKLAQEIIPSYVMKRCNTRGCGYWVLTPFPNRVHRYMLCNAKLGVNGK